MRLDRGDVVEAMKTMDADALRAQPLGCDDVGNEYWYFYGTRLYKQAPSPKKNEKKWEEEWNQQKQQAFKKRGPGRPPKKTSKLRKSDGESDEFEDTYNHRNRKYMNIDERSRWSVVCNTIEDWIEFAEKFKNSQSRCERALFNIVQENFLPALNDIYLEKERRLQKKLKELMALRSPAISRMETRRNITIVHDESNEETYEEQLDRDNQLEERSCGIREVLRPRRVTRKSVKYYDGEDNDGEMSEEISDERYEDPKETNIDKYVRDYFPLFSEDGIDVKKEVIKLIGEVKVHKDAWPFISPVKKEEAPGYYEIISQPIDLTIISQKLFDGSYRTLSQLDADFRKLVSNCRLYNGEHAGPTKMVNSIYKMFQQGVSKILDIYRGHSEMPSRNVENVHSTNKPKHNRSDVFVKRNNNTYERKKRKRKVCHMEALETLSRESELAVEKSNSSDYIENLQAKKESNRHASLSSFRIIPIHSNPTEVVEKLMSESSNQEDVEECNENITDMTEEAENSTDFDPNNSLNSQDSNVCGLFDSPDSEGNSSVFMDENEPDSVDSTQETEENTDVAVTSNLRSSSSSSQGLRKSSSGSTDGVMHSVANIIEDCRTQSVSNLMSGFNREPIYSMSERNASPNSRPVISPHSSKSDSSSPEHSGESPQNAIPSFTQSSIVEKHIPLLQDGLNIHSDFGNFTSSHETSTVDASVLGFSSYPQIPSRVSPLSSTLPNSKQISTSPVLVPNSVPSLLPLSGKQISPPPVSVLNSVPSFLPLSGKQISPPPVSVPNSVPSFLPLSGIPRFTGPQDTNPAYEKIFPFQNPIQLLKSDHNKFPTVQVNLPPSNGEILIVPDKNDSSKTVFHLFAQPHANQSQPIQSSVELRANISPTGFVNQSNEVLEVRSSKSESTTMTATRRKSPSMDSSQFPVVSNGPVIHQPFEKNIGGASFPNLLKPITTYPGFSVNSSSTSVSSSFANTFMSLNSNAIHPPSATSDISRSSSFNPLDISVSKASSIPNGMSFESETSATMLPNDSTRTVNSNFGTTLLSSRPPKSSKKIRHKVDASLHKETTNSVQKVIAPNGAYLFNPNGLMSNLNGQYEIVTLSKADDVQVSKLQNPDRSNQNGFKSFSESLPTAFYSPTYTNSLQNFTFPSSSLNPPLVYQVNPNSSSQFVNLPNYMLSNQNMFQHPLNHPIVNMQPFQVPNRPVISMDLSNR